MHAVPIGDYESQVPVQEGLRRIIPEVRPSQVGNAVEDLGFSAINAQRSMQAKDAAVYVGKGIAQARVSAEQTFLDAQQKPQEDIDKDGGFTPSVMKSFTDASKDLVANAPNPIAKQLMQSHLQQLGADLQIRAMKQDAENRAVQKVASATDSAKLAATAVELAPNSWKSAGGEQHASIANMGLPADIATKLQEQSNAVITQAAAKGYAKTNPAETLNRLNDPKDELFASLPLAQREATENYAKDQLATQTAGPIVDFYRNQGPTQGAKALQNIDHANLPDDVKQSVYQKVEAGLGQWHAEQRQVNAPALQGVEERLANGKTTLGDRGVVWDLYNKGAITDPGEMIGRIEKAQEKQVQDDAMRHYASEAYRTSTPLDPQDDQTKKAINDVFTYSTNGVAPGSPEWINRAADIGAKTGVTPKAAVDWSRTTLISGPPQDAARAAQTLQRMGDANPRGVGFAVDEHTKALAMMVNEAVHAGTDPTAAVEHARTVAALPEADRTRLDQIYRAKQYTQKSENDLTSLLKDTDNGFRSHFWQGIPDVPPEMTGEFEQLRSQYFKLTGGNVDQAGKLAVQDMKNIWGISEVNGPKEFMPFAPEAMNPGLTTSGVRADMEASAKGHTADPSKVRLIATADTYQSNGQRWGLGIPDQFGAFNVLTDEKGRMIPYQIPNGQQAFKSDFAKASADGLAKLHNLQSVSREKEQNAAGETIAQGRRLGAF